MSLHHPDHITYRHFTKRQRVDTAIHTLEGLLKGIALDDHVNAAEIAELVNWCNDHRDLVDRAPFDELIPRLDEMMADGVIDPDEQDDLLWLCNNLSAGSLYYDSITSEIQVLHGLLHGVLADGLISTEEAVRLQQWIDEHGHLKGTYPYDELESILIRVLADGTIDDEEQLELRAFFEEFIQYSMAKRMEKRNEPHGNTSAYSVSGVCATCPEVVLDGKTFTFTGSSMRGTRKQLAEVITGAAGKFTSAVTTETDYLVIGGEGNPCWAFSCYGRKVEQAVKLRKKGHPIVVVHESDFWDAVEDLDMGID